MGLEPVDVPADGNYFLYAARFALLPHKDWNPTLVPSSATIRADVVRFLTNSRMNILMDGRTLDEVRREMADPSATGRRKGSRLEHYDSWTKYLAYMKQPVKYIDTLFIFGFASLYKVSVRIITEILDEPQVFYLGFTPPMDVITLCFLLSADIMPLER